MRQKSISLDWTSLVERDFVFGVPNIRHATIIENRYFKKKNTKKTRKGRIYRFPTSLVKQFRYLKDRSRCTSGFRVEFITDSKSLEINAKWPRVSKMENMSPLAQQSIDILVDGKHWTLVSPASCKLPNRFMLPNDKEEHKITIVFPTYAPVKLRGLSLYRTGDGYPKKTSFEGAGSDKPVIFYGSSITQGGCATRPSLAYPHRLCQRLRLNYMNFGLSGAGRGETEIAEYIASFSDARLFILDWGANLLAPEHQNALERRYRNFWKVIHEKNPETPILFIGLQHYFHGLIDSRAARKWIESKRQFIKQEAEAACSEVNEGRDAPLFDYVDGPSIISYNDIGCTVDGTHPNDLGHKKYVDMLEWKVINLLQV